MTGTPGTTPPPPPTTGSSQNDGTPIWTAYTTTETNLATQLAALGYDTTQQPPQAYGNITAQNLDHPERHSPPTAPTNVVIGASGTSGTGKVTWTAPTSLPSQGYSVAVTDSGSVVATVQAAASATTVNVPGLTVGHSVTAVVTSVGAWVSAPSTASAAWTVV